MGILSMLSIGALSMTARRSKIGHRLGSRARARRLYRGGQGRWAYHRMGKANSVERKRFGGAL